MAARKSTRRKAKTPTRGGRASSSALGKSKKGLLTAIVTTDRATWLRLIAGVALIFILAKNWGYVVVPATVNNRPVFGWQFYGELQKRFGEQTLDSLVTQQILVQEAGKRGVAVTEGDIESRVTELEGQLAETGGIEQALSLSGMTREDLAEQIRLNLMVERLVEDRIEITEEEIAVRYEESKDLLGEIEESEAMARVSEQIRAEKIQEEVSALIQELRDTASINIYTP